MNDSLPRRIVMLVAVVTLMLTSFAAGNVTGYFARSVHAQQERTLTEFAVFWEAWDIVLEHFVDQDKIDFQAMSYGAIQGMLDSLGDQNHTVFFSPEVAEQQESALEGSFEGIGAYVSSDEGQFKIVAPIHGSPAEEAGILAGDVVLAVDGTDIFEVPEWEVITMIRGPSDTTVTLTVVHPDAEESIDIEIERGRIDIESVLWSRIAGTDLVHIQISQFAGDTSRELKNALREIMVEADDGKPVAGIMLDLRNNPGGYLQEALRVASQFLPEGDIILHERDAKEKTTTYRSQGSGMARDIPLVVLVNPGSASAAEIVAGALQENERGKLIGAATVGTGTVLRPFSLKDGSVLRLGVTNWLTPEYSLIKGAGIQPDVKIEQNAAVEMMNSFVLETASEQEVRAHEDRQFQTALLMLHLLTEPSDEMTTSSPVSETLMPQSFAP